MPIVCFLFGLVSFAADISNTFRFTSVGEPYRTAFFYDQFRDSGFEVNFILIVCAFLIALINFKCQWSKKECNVLYSLGLKRSQIYNAKILGGLVPMTGAALALFVLGFFGNLIAKSTVDMRYWSMAIFTTFSWIAVFAASYLVCCLVFTNTGNPVEAVIFLAVFTISPMVFESFLRLCAEGYTLGGNNTFLTGNDWAWSTPFFTKNLFNGYMSWASEFEFTYFEVGSTQSLTIFDFSSPIMSTVYAAALYALGLVTFKKRRNETAGTWGRSTGITNIAGAVAGFEIFTIVLAICVDCDVYGNQGFLTFLICCACFLATQIIFKLIFSVRRKYAVKTTLNRFPAHVAVLGAVTLVFALGLFGYSSYVPELNEVKSVAISTPVISHDDEFLSGESCYALRKMNMISMYTDRMYVESQSEQYNYYNDGESIEAFIKLHKTIIADGKIRDKAPDACAVPIIIQYNLKNGKTVTRTYFESTTETAKKILAINDLSETKEYINTLLDFGENLDTAAEALGNTLGRTVYIEDWLVFDKDTGEQIGCVKNADNMLHFFSNDGNSSIPFDDFAFADAERTHYISTAKCFLYPKDMTKGYCVGTDTELIKAVKADIAKQSAAEYYMHKPEDEIGVLSFGLSSTSYNYDEGLAYGVVEDGYNPFTDEGMGDITELYKDGSYSKKISWNISSWDIKAVVVTKDMTNTIKYLESHDLMKHFENTRKVSDIKAVKLATPAELYPNTQSHNIPLFFAGYWDTDTVEQYKLDPFAEDRLFDKVSNEITDVERITKLLDGSVLFGYCDNDYRIMEISYNDGSIATVLVPTDVYNSIMG